MGLVEAPDFLTLEEAAAILRIGRNQAYELARVWRANNAGCQWWSSAGCCVSPRRLCCDWPGWQSRSGRNVSAEPEGCSLRVDARALGLGYRLGSDTLLLLLDLAAHATDSPEGIVSPPVTATSPAALAFPRTPSDDGWPPCGMPGWS